MRLVRSPGIGPVTIRTLDVAPTVANILGFKMAECEGKALGELI